MAETIEQSRAPAEADKIVHSIESHSRELSKEEFVAPLHGVGNLDFVRRSYIGDVDPMRNIKKWVIAVDQNVSISPSNAFLWTAQASAVASSECLMRRNHLRPSNRSTAAYINLAVNPNNGPNTTHQNRQYFPTTRCRSFVDRFNPDLKATPSFDDNGTMICWWT